MVRSRQRIPDRIKNAPVLKMGLELFLGAWFDLSSCRTSGLGEGAIPWTQVEEYGRALELEPDTLEDLHHHIRAMEVEFAAYRKKKNG